VTLRATGVLSLACLAGFGSWARSDESRPAKVSRPGDYRGFSEAVYDGWSLSSIYVTVRDGTRLAIDIFRPTKNGAVVDDRLPVLWMHSPYNRRPKDGASEAETYAGGPLSLVKYGYVVAVVDFRGLYASFGRNKLFNSGEYVGPAWTDAYDVTEWLAKQPWSSGKIGMWGCSATGGSQLQAAATRPPSLKAVFALSPQFDAYDFFNYGGAPTGSPGKPATSAERDLSASPVDGPDGPRLLALAKAEHADDPASESDLPFRDSPSATLGRDWFTRSSPTTYLEQFRQSDLAVYTGGNWDESSTKIAPALLWANLPKGRAKLVFAPHGHCGWSETADQDGFSIQVEERRFFDYWLKGVKNGVMDEPPITYYTYNALPGKAWRQSNTWPLPNEIRTRYYLGQGGLDVGRPGVTTHSETPMGPPAKVTPIKVSQAPGGMLYETRPLADNVEVTGYPVADLWVSADASDADVVAQIDDVAPDGTARSYQMVGRLRASHRKLTQAPYQDFGLPHQSHLSTDVEPLPKGAPVELRFAMTPMSYVFPKGHRIRLSVTVSNPAAKPGERALARLWSGPANPSSIELPVIPE
jgi:predicted acyl esterase